jgi:hypothetical protein
VGLSLAEMALGRFPIGSTHNEWLEFIMTKQSPFIDVQFCGLSFQEFINKWLVFFYFQALHLKSKRFFIIITLIVFFSLQFDPEKRLRPKEFDNNQFILEHTPMNKMAVSQFIIARLPYVLSQLANQD